MSGSKPGSRPNAGRPKGSKNKEKGAIVKARTDRAAAALAPAEKPAAARRARAPLKAPAGIAPKDLLLATMRNAWEMAHAKSFLAKELDKEAEGLVKAGGAPEEVAKLRDAAAKARIEAGLHVTAATNLAKDVAPYEHPKLANVDNRLSGVVIVENKMKAF